jgi:hypothetical protein
MIVEKSRGANFSAILRFDVLAISKLGKIPFTDWEKKEAGSAKQIRRSCKNVLGNYLVT